MTREVSPAWLAGATIAALLAAALLFGCGSGGGSTSNPEGNAGSQGPANSPVQGKPTGGGDAAKPRYEGVEEEVEQLGSEAAGSEREAVIGAEQGYLTALSEQDYATACALLGKTVHAQLQQLVQGRKVGCAAILPRLLGPPAASAAHVQLEGEVKKVRLKGSRAFVIFHASGARLFIIGLTREAGKWRVGNLSASVLAPSKSALEGG